MENGSEQKSVEDSSRKMFIGGLTADTDENHLKEYFSKFGEIEDVIVVKDPQRNKSRRFAFLDFKDSSSIDSVLEESTHEVLGKQVHPKRAISDQEKMESSKMSETRKVKEEPPKSKVSVTPLPPKREWTKAKAESALHSLFPKIKAALFDLSSDYVTPGDTPFYCHFCKVTSDNEKSFKAHVGSQEHAVKLAERKRYLSELIESFYTANQTIAVCQRRYGKYFNVCAKCMLPYFEIMKVHRTTEEHEYSIGLVRPECVKCSRYFSSRFDLEEHMVTLDHIYSVMAGDDKRLPSSHPKIPKDLPEEYTGDEAVGVHHIRHASAFFCTPCQVHLKKTLKTLKVHCALDSHIENVKKMKEKLEPVRQKRQQQIENEKAKRAKELGSEEEKEMESMNLDEDEMQTDDQ